MTPGFKLTVEDSGGSFQVWLAATAPEGDVAIIGSGDTFEAAQADAQATLQALYLDASIELRKP